MTTLTFEAAEKVLGAPEEAPASSPASTIAAVETVESVLGPGAEVDPTAEVRGEFMKGVLSGTDQMQASMGAGTEMLTKLFQQRYGEGDISNTIRDWGREVRERNMLEAQQYAPKVGRVEDVRTDAPLNFLEDAAARASMMGILWMLVYALMISGMHVSVRWVSEGLHPFEIAFFRNLFGLVVVLPWFIRLGWAPLRTKRLGMLMTRGVLNTACMLAFFTGLAIVPLAEAVALTFTSPIFATILAVFVFREVVGPRRWIAIGIGFVGVFVVLRPGFQAIDFGQVLVLGSAVCWGLCLVIIKSLGRTESAVTITTYMSLVMAPLSLVPALFVWVWPTWEQLAWLLMIGALGGVGQLAMSQSLRLADTHVVTPIDFSRLIFVAILGYLLFAQVPDVYVWIGGAMIFAAIAFIAYREHVVRQRARTAAARS